MYPDEELQRIHGVICHHKEHLVVHHGEYNMAPVMALHWRDDVSHQIDLAECMNKLHEQLSALPEGVLRILLDPPRVIHGILEMIATDQWPVIPSHGQAIPAPSGPLEGIWLSLEQFRDPRAIVDIENLPIKGDLQHDYETNPDSAVLEAIATYIVETGADGLAEWARLSSCHKRVDGGGLAWQETEIRRSDTDPLVDPEHDELLNVMCRFVTRESLA